MNILFVNEFHSFFFVRPAMKCHKWLILRWNSFESHCDGHKHISTYRYILLRISSWVHTCGTKMWWVVIRRETNLLGWLHGDHFVFYYPHAEGACRKQKHGLCWGWGEVFHSHKKWDGIDQRSAWCRTTRSESRKRLVDTWELLVVCSSLAEHVFSHKMFSKKCRIG